MTRFSRRLTAAALAALALGCFPVSGAWAKADADGKAANDKAGAPAAPAGDWRVGPVMGADGRFIYCLAENGYDNGRALMVTRSSRDEFNIGLGLPGAHLAKGAAWRVKLAVDGLKRDRQAVVAESGLLSIANGGDDRLYDALIHGEVLTIEGPSDSAAFQLKGVNKALGDLRGCVERARSGQSAKPLGRVGAGKPELPPLLRKLLAEAGFKTVGLPPASATPPGHGQVDNLWRIGPVTSGLGELQSEGAQSLPSLVEEALARLKARCGADAPVTQGRAETLPRGAYRTATVGCGSTHVSLLFNLGRGGLFQAFFFEAPSRDAAAADKQRDAVLEVLKRVDNL